MKRWLKELAEYGYARLCYTKKGKRWEFCEFPNQVWLEAAKAIHRISHDGNFGRKEE